MSGAEVDGPTKKSNKKFYVLLAKATQRRSLDGIQSFQTAANSLDSGFHRSDDFYESIRFCPSENVRTPNEDRRA